MPNSVTTPIAHVIGAGPVGLAMALLLARDGHRVTVYEAQEQITSADGESYPIGVNPRGQETLRLIDPRLSEQLRAHSEVVQGWRIYAGQRVVARLQSGSVLSTTRAYLTTLLLEAARQHPDISVVMGHRLRDVEVSTRTLVFETADGQSIRVESSGGRVYCAEGVRSAARESLTRQIPGFTPDVQPWGVQFRVLFSRDDASAPELDRSLHYIFGGKGIYTATLGTGVWCLALTAVDGAPEKSLLLADEATGENVRALRAYVEEHAPLAAPLFTDAEYEAYFTRRAYSGAVVRCPSLHVDEWLVLLGDAAHSVGPPTGEGVNAGLEDCRILTSALTSGSESPFTDYNAARLPDLHALGAYAADLMANICTTDPVARTTNVLLRIAAQLGTTIRRQEGVETRLFGPDADLTPYRDILGPWQAQREALRPPLTAAVRSAHTLRAYLRHLPRRPTGVRQREQRRSSGGTATSTGR